MEKVQNFASSDDDGIRRDSIFNFAFTMEIVFRAAGHLRTACRVPVAAARVTAIVYVPRSRKNYTRVSMGGFEGRLRVGGQKRGVRGGGRARRIPFRRPLCVLSGVATSRRRLRRLENLSEQALSYTHYTLYCIYLSARWRWCVYSERLNAFESPCQHYFFCHLLISRPISFTAVELQQKYIYFQATAKIHYIYRG